MTKIPEYKSDASALRPVALLLDLDGTLYTGGAPIPGAPALLTRLRSRGVPFRLVTNTTTRSRSMLVERLRGYGFEAAPEDIFTATLAGAAAVRAAGHRVVAPFLPAAALEDLAGLQLSGGVAGAARSRPDVVLLGDLGQGWSYALLQEAFEHLMAGAELVALSRDRYFQQGDGLALDAGPFVAALEYATGRTARVAGKPSSDFYAAALASLGVTGPAAMVGDDLWSDVDGAQRAGLAGWLVRTGKFREELLRSSGIRPDRILSSVAALAEE
ncbi:MAG TPA: HAD-IIA family hydrolase [Gemmatimonadales bacterium]|nr:HAD-IIA family hydrolase [Gemmatimonadales bacterium]